MNELISINTFIHIIGILSAVGAVIVTYLFHRQFSKEKFSVINDIKEISKNVYQNSEKRFGTEKKSQNFIENNKSCDIKLYKLKKAEANVTNLFFDKLNDENIYLEAATKQLLASYITKIIFDKHDILSFNKYIDSNYRKILFKNEAKDSFSYLNDNFTLNDIYFKIFVDYDKKYLLLWMTKLNEQLLKKDSQKLNYQNPTKLTSAQVVTREVDIPLSDILNAAYS